MKHHVQITINGRSVDTWVEERKLLVQFLREDMELTGAHIGCVIGECGACSILLDGEIIKSCLILAVQANGHEITTIEGIEDRGKLDSVQQSFVDEYGVQCGYCSPGMILSSHALLANNPNPTEAEVRYALAGNTCMCTGYGQIIKAVLRAAEQVKGQTT